MSAMESSVSDLDANLCNPFLGYYDAALHFSPKWRCNILHFWFATFGISIMQQTASFYNISINDLLRYTVKLDPDIYYDAIPPSESGSNLDDFLEYLKEPRNQKRFKDFSSEERELIYCFEQIDPIDRWELLEFVKILTRKRRKK